MSNTDFIAPGGSIILSVGYTLAILGVIIVCISDNLSQSLYKKYSIFCVLLSVSLLQCIITLLIVVVLLVFQSEILHFPSGTACFSLAIAFMCFMTAGHFLFKVSFLYFMVSQSAAVNGLTIIGLYIIQRTVFKELNPGNANVMEIIGVVIVTLLSIVNPVLVDYFKNM